MKYIITLALALISASCEKKDSSSTDSLKIATSGDNPPYEFYKEGKLTGFDIELGHAIAGIMGKKAEFVDIPFDSIIASLQSKKVDMAIAGLAASAERKASIDFSVPYHENNTVLVTVGLTDIKNIKNLEGKIIGAQLGSVNETYGKTILKKHVNVEIQTLSKLTDLIQNLKTGRIDGLIVGIPEADKIKESHDSFNIMTLPEGSGSESVGLPKGSPLTDHVDQAIGALEKDGTLDNLRMKWNLK